MMQSPPKNIMAYLREVEGKLLECRQIQSKFKVQSFVLGAGFGILFTLAWFWFMSRRPF